MTNNTNTASDLTVSRTIAEQIGNRAFFMMGAKDLMGDETSLTFRIGRNSRSVSHIKITLDCDDTYTVEFLRVRTSHKTYQTTRTIVSSEPMVYAEDLHRIIESGTGLYLSL
jgi:hypothetical protein